MQKFTFYNPTRYIFGKGQLSQLGEEVQKVGKKVFLVYGGGSIKKNGIYEGVMEQLRDCEVLEFGGVEPNPRFETLVKAIPLVQKFQPDIILAVGGGSVIDGAKFIAAAAYYEGEDLWDIIRSHGEKIAEKVIPLGVVLTISATGSEVNGGSVITHRGKNLKDFFSVDATRPVFSIVDPEFQYSLPVDQLAYGIIDAFSHVLEQYITQTTDFTVQDRFAEALLLSLIEEGPRALQNKQEYTARANVAFAASLALNNLIGSGVNQDWATHEMEHVVSGFYDIPHAAGLAVITPHWMHVVALDQKFEKMVRYGKNVWNLSGSDQEIASKAIDKTAEFFASLGVKMSFTEWNIPKEDVEKLVQSAVKRDELGEITMTENQVREVFLRCF